MTSVHGRRLTALGRHSGTIDGPGAEDFFSGTRHSRRRLTSYQFDSARASGPSTTRPRPISRRPFSACPGSREPEVPRRSSSSDAPVSSDIDLLSLPAAQFRQGSRLVVGFRPSLSCTSRRFRTRSGRERRSIPSARNQPDRRRGGNSGAGEFAGHAPSSRTSLSLGSSGRSMTTSLGHGLRRRNV